MGKYDPQKHHRRTIRLRGYDYGSPGAYFVTLCTEGRKCVLNDPVLSGIVQAVWYALPGWFPTIELDEFVIMPNHIHFIVWIHPPRDGEAIPTDIPDAVAPGAGTDTIPTDIPDAVVTDVGATPAVAPNAVAPGAGTDTVPTVGPGTVGPGGWIIPTPQQVNLHPTLGDVVGAFKSLVFKVYLDWIRDHDPERQARIWQRNYYEHIIRNERELEAIRFYIQQNPKRWRTDRDNLDNTRRLPPPRDVSEYVREAMENDARLKP